MMLTTTTVHQEVMRGIEVCTPTRFRPATKVRHLKRNRPGDLRMIVARAMVRQAERETQHLCRDYRPGIGSGRSAHWLNVIYTIHCRVAAALVQTGLRGVEVGALARAVCRVENLADWDKLPPPPAKVVFAVVGSTIPETYGWVCSASGAVWATWHAQQFGSLFPLSP